jgi:DNA-binding transcriptional MerR regulator
MLRPVKSAKGQRRYREQDIAVIEEIKRLLYEEGFTIAGARKHMKEAGAGAGAGTLRSNAFDSLDDTADISPPLRNQGRRALRGARDELRAILKLLNEK